MHGKVSAADGVIEVFVATALLGAVRITEVNGNTCSLRNFSVPTADVLSLPLIKTPSQWPAQDGLQFQMGEHEC